MSVGSRVGGAIMEVELSGDKGGDRNLSLRLRSQTSGQRTKPLSGNDGMEVGEVG